MAVPYVIGTKTAIATTATTVTVTTGSGTGDAIAVLAATPLAGGTAPTSVTDTRGNSYVLATTVTANLGVWLADGPTPLTTSDTVTVTWSSSNSTGKAVQVIGVPGAASISALDPASAAATGTGTAVSVTSGTPATTTDIAILAIADSASGGTPSGLGSFTTLGTIEPASYQFLTAAYQQLAAATPVTGSATIVSAQWSAVVLLVSPSAVAGSGGTVVGATIEAGSYTGTLSGSIGTWQNQVINPGRTLDSIRVFFGPGNIPASASSAGLTQHAGVRRVLMSFKPALAGSGGEAADKAALNTLLADCKAQGLDAKVALYHEPDSAAGLTATQYKTTIQYYSATVRTYYPLVYCKAAYRTHVSPSSVGAYYPGDAYVDECAYDFYETDWRLYGVTMDSMAVIADGASPPKNLSCWELGVTVSSISGTTSPAPATKAQGTAYMQYVLNYFKTRQSAGKGIGDLSYYDYINSAQNWNFVIGTPGNTGNYLAPLYDNIYDSLSGTGSTAPANIASELGITVELTESLATTTVTPPGGPAPGSATFPQIIAEAGFTPAAPVAVLGSFILDDPVYGRLDSNRLAPSTTWTDISAYVRSGSITRPSTRTQGPLYAYQPATLSLVLKNGDGRFDPDNTTSPYAGGIRPMIPVRVSATWNGINYPLFYGFADSWADDGVNYAGRYAQCTLSATDGFKVLAGINLAAVTNPLGDAEDTGARIARILNAAGWYTSLRTIGTGNSQLQGTTYGDSPLNLMQLTADSEIGELYVNGAGNVVFRNRHAVLTDARSAAPQAIFGDSPGTTH